ncbi:AraC family transcriptional regulator [Sagittula sp. SSi028]|uniref:AraC family transcriptional regulator n=1 Tax=Sagittula sp. SSi028 TaxID=3400636 RepID=UPI003AF7D9B1
MLESDVDPLCSFMALFKLTLTNAKVVEAGGQWMAEGRDTATPFYCAMSEGQCRLHVAGREPVTLSAGDFVLIPHLQDFIISSEVPPPPHVSRQSLETGSGECRLGAVEAPVNMRALVGRCHFDPLAQGLLASLLPGVIHVSDQNRLTALVSMIHEETRANRLGRRVILERLLEVLLIEALRSEPVATLPPGLLRGLSDPLLSGAFQRIHTERGGSLSGSQLAKTTGLSRSGFLERFHRQVGRTPKEYAIEWRMAVAKTLLRQGGLTNAEIAERIGYASAITFGMAFVRQEGISPGAFAKRAGG